MIQKSLAAIAILLLSLSAIAEVRYVTDSMYIPVRSGEGTQFRIIHKGLRSGTQLTLIKAPKGSEWSQVKMPNGNTGWIRNQYLKKTPTSRLKLVEVQKQLALSSKKIDSLKTTLTQLQAEHRTLSTDSSKQSKEHGQLSEKYKKLSILSADSVNLSHRYQEILEKYDMLKTESDTAHAENDRLKSEKTINQWLFGAGLIILGMFLMLILPALKPQKGNGDWVN